MKKALPNLEVLRFVAAVAIVIWHYQHFSYVGPARVDFATRDQPFFGQLHLAYTAGALAVPLFWLLSGYIFFHQYSKRITLGRISARQFAILRFSRLYPLHIATMIAVLILQWNYRRVTPLNLPFVYQHNEGHDVLLHLAMASQWAEHRRYSINGPVWSVSMEVLGYAAFFVAMRFMPKPMWAIAPAPFLLIWSINTYSMLGTMFALFFLGGALWLMVNHMPRLTLFGVVAFTLWGAHRLAPQFLKYVSFTPRSTMAAYAVFAGIVATAAWLPQVSGKTARIFEHLGGLTYSSYLLHFPLQLAAVTLATAVGEVIPWRNPMVLVAYLATVFALAQLTYRYFERPVQEWLRTRLLPQWGA